MRRLIVLLFLLALWAPVAGRSTHDTPDAATENMAWWGDMARGYVVSGCLPAVPVPASLTLALPPCQAYARHRAARRLAYLWEPTTRPLTLSAATGRTWLAGHASVADAVPGWTRVPGTHYLWQAGSLPPEPPEGGTLLAAVDVAGGVITTIGDARPDSPIPGAPANLQSPLFGARGDCVTDDTAAMQQWINNVAWRNTEGYAPASCYLFTRLWLTWEAAMNPGFPPESIERGGYLLRGAGPAQVYHAGQDKRLWPGTVWWSSATTAPALNALAPVGSGTGNAGRGIRLENLSLVQQTSSPVMEFDGVHSRSGLRDLFVVQAGTGYGIRWKNSFLTWVEDVFIHAQTPASNTGVGLELYNTSTSGGVVRLTNVTARQFGAACVRVGGLAADATQLQNVHMQGVQGTNCPIGLEVWGGVRSLACDGCYFEHFRDYGVHIKESARAVSLVNSWFAAGDMTDVSDAAIRIGTGETGLAGEAVAVHLQNNTIVDVDAGAGIWRDLSSVVQGGTILTNVIAFGPLARAGIHCGQAGTTHYGLLLFGNVFRATAAGAGTNAVDATCRTGEVIADATSLWLGRRVNFGQGTVLPSAPTLLLPPEGNLYNLTGTETITTITCDPCLPGAFVWFFVPSGNTPVMTEAGNLLLDDNASPANQWTGAGNSVIGLLYTTLGKWVELYRKDN